ncbi:dipeptide/oligopeptide/nickel ABC transporter ATP-binding protein [Insulibacter thermoxylanivorax]|uniref:Dipeptide/oligopeptide/nickel ABC transporter ATP-binding protein n=1 Tax=Insulibacter thermoxylanivorax TaxID=2749268 RepID=A0A916QBB8_9BACL|nr:ABC transporter ATP-binding protein [Insulibacter thermoxylanivorax]GFR37600.1 dipeptide/oligopeptide/nickel ABC transporter ATP-binding protein [Insulibacter thermoxylanivorax]
MTKAVLSVKNLTVSFKQSGGRVAALRNVSFTLNRGEILGLVGESGSGKSLTALTIMKLLPQQAQIEQGEIRLEGEVISRLSEKEMRRYRGSEVSMIFQEPMTALNPLASVGKQIEEMLTLHKKLSKKEKKQKVIELLTAVGIPEPELRYRQYPFELSGGMRQRIMIAMALACDPKVIIADEPTTALDVTIQAQILDLLKEIKAAFDTSILLITHDMGVIADAADRVAVMYGGRLMEMAGVEELFERPRHPYTVGLLKSMPDMTKVSEGELATIPGSVPDLKQMPEGCPFHPRCPYATEKCRNQMPPLVEDHEGHAAACWHPVKGVG